MHTNISGIAWIPPSCKSTTKYSKISDLFDQKICNKDPQFSADDTIKNPVNFSCSKHAHALHDIDKCMQPQEFDQKLEDLTKSELFEMDGEFYNETLLQHVNSKQKNAEKPLKKMIRRSKLRKIQTELMNMKNRYHDASMRLQSVMEILSGLEYLINLQDGELLQLRTQLQVVSATENLLLSENVAEKAKKAEKISFQEQASQTDLINVEESLTVCVLHKDAQVQTVPVASSDNGDFKKLGSSAKETTEIMFLKDPDEISEMKSTLEIQRHQFEDLQKHLQQSEYDTQKLVESVKRRDSQITHELNRLAIQNNSLQAYIKFIKKSYVDMFTAM